MCESDALTKCWPIFRANRLTLAVRLQCTHYISNDVEPAAVGVVAFSRSLPSSAEPPRSGSVDISLS